MASELTDRQLQRGLMSDISETRAMARECIAARERIAELEAGWREESERIGDDNRLLAARVEDLARDLEVARADAAIMRATNGGGPLDVVKRVEAYAAGKPVSVRELQAKAWDEGAREGYSLRRLKLASVLKKTPYGKEFG